MSDAEPVPPIGTQISALAALAPDEPAVTCDGLTITRGELDRSTNRLARAYAERGVGVGDYVTMVLPNSIEWIQAAVACWKLGAVPQPLSARLPDAELQGLLELAAARPAGGPRIPAKYQACQPVSLPTRHVVRRRAAGSGFAVWKSMASGGSTGRPKLIEVRRRQPDTGRHRVRRSARRRATPRWCRCR